MKRLIAFIFLLFIFLHAHSKWTSCEQIWYFGNGAGLDFSSGKAKAINGSKLYSEEGCATVCDENGKLMFYTNGISVWNKFHNVIENGEGLNSSRSSTQSSLIVTKPGTKNVFFLFTTDEKAGKKGLCYSVIDMSSEKGTVTMKNTQLLLSSTEKITAVQHVNGKDVWVIAHQWNSNYYLAFPVTSKGVGAPVISSGVVSHAETGGGDNREAIGYLKASPDGKKIASAICYRSKNNLEIIDFNNSTGKISDPYSLSVAGFPYGLCFSPDNSKLYISFLKGKHGIIQYEMNEKTTCEIVSNEKENSFGSLQLGPDKKIYVARTGNQLDVIEYSDKKGISCGFKKNGIDLSPASSNYGLPNFWVSALALSQPAPSSIVSKTFDCSKIIEKPFSNKDKLLMTEISVCENQYTLTAKNFGASFNWSTLSTTQKINVDTSGLFRVAITKNGCTLTDSIRIHFRKDYAVFRFLPDFNPESEFFNSEFYYEITDVREFELKVFDQKKKHILFETKNPGVKWNGKNPKGQLVPSAEYFWTVTYKPNCPKDSKTVTKEGTVMVKRKK